MHMFGRLSALALVSVSLFACGDDGPAKLIDSGIGNTDARPKVCTAVAAVGSMEADVTDEDKDRYIRYYADAGDINGDPLYIYMTFRHSTAVPTIPATVDVMADAANQDFYTCTTCVYALQFDPMTFDVKKIFFQQSGSVAFTGEPVTTRHLTANFANLKPESMQQSGLRGIASRHGYRVESMGLTLYNLKDDPGEKTDVSAKHPDVVKRLQAVVAEARADLGDLLTKVQGPNVRPAGRAD